jgi:hypothetical protein
MLTGRVSHQEIAFTRASQPGAWPDRERFVPLEPAVDPRYIRALVWRSQCHTRPRSVSFQFLLLLYIDQSCCEAVVSLSFCVVSVAWHVCFGVVL